MRRCELAIAALLVAGTAAADPAADAYEEGRRLYDLREWDQAIAKFKEAYRLRPEPKSMFNIAQAYRLKGDCGEAIQFYRTYKRNFPAEKNIAKVDKFIEELEACAKQERKPAPAPDKQPSPTKQPTKQIVTPPPVPTETHGDPSRPPPPEFVDQAPVFEPERGPEAPRDAGQSRRRLAIALGAGGMVALAGGIYFGFQAQDYSDDVTTGGGVWDPDLEARGKRADVTAKLLVGLGGAAIATGAILYVTAPSPRTQLGIVPRLDGAFVVWGGAL
jgi:tetratricopeptide (TPR) repeat protein